MMPAPKAPRNMKIVPEATNNNRDSPWHLPSYQMHGFQAPHVQIQTRKMLKQEPGNKMKQALKKGTKSKRCPEMHPESIKVEFGHKGVLSAAPLPPKRAPKLPRWSPGSTMKEPGLSNDSFGHHQCLNPIYKSQAFKSDLKTNVPKPASQHTKRHVGKQKQTAQTQGANSQRDGGMLWDKIPIFKKARPHNNMPILSFEKICLPLYSAEI